MKTVKVFQFNGCQKCSNETLLLKCPENNGDDKDIEWIDMNGAVPNDNFDYAVITGYITENDAERLKNIREKAGKVVLFGSCACYGGLFGLMNQRMGNVVPAKKIITPDLEIPGCLASSTDLQSFIEVAKHPSKDPLCKSCNRKASCDFLTEIQRQVDLSEVDAEQCFNDFGYTCNGFVANECPERCIDFGAPCRGCTPFVSDSGFRMLSSMGTLMGQMDVATEACPKGKTDKLADEEDEISRAFPDVVGTFFRFVLPDSMISKGKLPSQGDPIADVLVGRPIEELPSITGMMGGNNFISFTLDLIEAYEKGIGLDVPEDVKELRKQLREAQAAYEKAVKDKDALAYYEAKSQIKNLAGNMNLSNLYYGGFRTLSESLKKYGEKILAKPVEFKEGTFGAITVNEKGVITAYKP